MQINTQFENVHSSTHRWYPAASAAVGIPRQPWSVFRPGGCRGRTELGRRWNTPTAGAVGRLVSSPQVQKLEAPGWILSEKSRSRSLKIISNLTFIQITSIVSVKYHAWCVLQEPWNYQHQETRAKTAGSTDSPILYPHMGSHWMSLQGDQTWGSMHLLYFIFLYCVVNVYLFICQSFTIYLVNVSVYRTHQCQLGSPFSLFYL